MVGLSSGSSWQLYGTTTYLYMLGTTINAVLSSEVVLLVHLKERILFFDLAVTEININFEINIKKV